MPRRLHFLNVTARTSKYQADPVAALLPNDQSALRASHIERQIRDHVLLSADRLALAEFDQDMELAGTVFLRCARGNRRGAWVKA